MPGRLDGDIPCIYGIYGDEAVAAGVAFALFSKHIFAPYASLAFHAFVFLKAFIAVPLQTVMSYWTAYAAYLCTFTGWFRDVSPARHLTRDAFLPGLQVLPMPLVPT